MVTWLGLMAPMTSADWSPAFIGTVSLPTGLEYRGTEVGGLSAIDFDAGNASYVVLSDDRSQRADARAYRLTLAIGDGVLETDDVRLVARMTLRDADDRPYASDTVDPEGLRLLPDGGFVWSSEGYGQDGLGPAVMHSDSDGRELQRYPLPAYYQPGPGRGIRHNRAFESLALSVDGRALFAALENALLQDGPAADLEQGSPVRVLRIDLETGTPTNEYIYPVGTVPHASAVAPRRYTNGLVELLALDEDCFIAVERSFVQGVRWNARLYRTCIGAATDVLGRARLDGDIVADAGHDTGGAGAIRPMTRTLLFDLADLGIVIDNIEGVSLGQKLPDGRRSLVLVSDNNFNTHQVTQFLAFALPPVGD